MKFIYGYFSDLMIRTSWELQLMTLENQNCEWVYRCIQELAGVQEEHSDREGRNLLVYIRKNEREEPSRMIMKSKKRRTVPEEQIKRLGVLYLTSWCEAALFFLVVRFISVIIVIIVVIVITALVITCFHRFPFHATERPANMNNT